MRVIRSARRMAQTAAKWRRAGARIGVVPTMGALHDGHRALIRAAARQTDVVIVSIFVNPLQFGPREDFRRYPRRLSRDVRLARAAGAEVVFAPAVSQMYPPGFRSSLQPGPLARRWEGRSRPGHFHGVVTVVARLCELTQPTDAYFGQKDYQQALIVRQLIQDLRLPLRFHLVPTVREPDGLAMSSRNAYLTPAQRRQAAALIRALRLARSRIRAGRRLAAPIIDEMRRLIRAAGGVRIDYLAVVDAQSLEPRLRLRGRVAVLGAVRVDGLRLIDNLLVDVQ